MNEENQMNEENRIPLSLTKVQLIAVLVFYIALLVGALVGITFFFIEFSDVAAQSSDSIWLSLVGSFLSAVLGSGVFYTRKLYKLCIRNELEMAPRAGAKEWGCTLYFSTRPIFSCVFAFLIVISLKIESQFVSLSGNIDSTNFVYVSMFVSFLSGFSAGKVISLLEKKGTPIHV